MRLFARYTEPARRAIFFARGVTLYSEHAYIEPLDLLRGLIFEGDRVQTIFKLREFFPLYKGHPAKSYDLRLKIDGPPLDIYSRQILRETSAVATNMGDFWIDTEHILLGILLVPHCDAARYLARTGLTFLSAREQIEQNRGSRPDYGPIPRSWRVRRRLTKLFG